MQEGQPVNGLSRELSYIGGEQSTVEFIGAANVWQGEKQDTQVKADKVTIDGKTGNLLAQGSVVSQMMVQDTNPTKKVKEVTRSTATGQQMSYDDTLRTVTYTTKAQLVGPQGHLSGETIVLTLGENGQDIDRLEADGECHDDRSQSCDDWRSSGVRGGDRGIQRLEQGTAGPHAVDQFRGEVQQE